MYSCVIFVVNPCKEWNYEFPYSVGHAIGRDAFIDEGIIVPLSKLFDDLEDIVRKNAHKAIEMVSETPAGKGR